MKTVARTLAKATSRQSLSGKPLDSHLLRRSMVHLHKNEEKSFSYDHEIHNLLELYPPVETQTDTTPRINVQRFKPTHADHIKFPLKPAHTPSSPPLASLSTPAPLLHPPLPDAHKSAPQDAAAPSNPALPPKVLHTPTPATHSHKPVLNGAIPDDNMHTCEAAPIGHAPNSFYRRPLPENLVAFSSTEGRKLFRDALAQGYMEGYFALAEQFVSQSEPAYCGPATLAMCLNALNIDPNRLWKGPWRWFAEDMLDCCTPLDVVKKRGITFTEFACLARCNGATVTSVRGDDSSLEGFRSAIKEATTQESLHLVVSYSRQVLGQTGQGHYSPIGGYHPEKDLALVMDVARFKYAPHWVPVESLWKSMRELDQDTKKPRGYYLLTRSKDHRPPTVCRITSKTMWAAVAAHLSTATPTPPQNAAELVEDIVLKLPSEASLVLRTYPEDLHGRLPREHADVLKQFFEEISKSEMCTIVREVLTRIPSTPFHTKYGPEILGVLFLACPPQLFGSLSPQVRDDLTRVRSLEPLSKEVQSELLQIREQMFLALKTNCKQCKFKGQPQLAQSCASK